MEQSEQWVYNNEVLRGHSLYYSCPSTLNEVSNRDYPNTNYFNPDIECLNMDFYEHKVLRKWQANNTVDAVIGISSYEKNQAKNPRLLLVELRIDYDNVSNLSKTEMERKVCYTKSLLSGEKPINRESVFIFNEKLASRAVSWFSRESRTGGELQNSLVYSVLGFAEKVKSLADFPYEPIHTKEEIQKSILFYKDKLDWMMFFKQVRYWNEVTYSCNPMECRHIQEAVKEIWKSFRQEKYELTDDEESEAMVLEEDIYFLNDVN